jgi:hypothetical protein
MLSRQVSVKEKVQIANEKIIKRKIKREKKKKRRTRDTESTGYSRRDDG